MEYSFNSKKICLLLSVIFILLIVYILQGIYLPTSPMFGPKEIFTIEKGESIGEIAKSLNEAGFIRNRTFFEMYVILTGKTKKLQAGDYLLSPLMNVPTIVNYFISGKVAEVKITIPEGFTIKQIEEELNSEWLLIGDSCKDICFIEKFNLKEQKIKDYEQKYNFLVDAPKEIILEGFLFPDTYQFSYKIKNEEIIGKMFDNFDKKLTSDLREEIKKQKKTIFEIITMASLLEKEVKTKEDKEIVSGILWKRLKIGMPLQVDATISYITGKKNTEISVEETKIDSPYNTYKYRGLPLGPISNPGLESVMAAIYPKNSLYWYYLSIPEGKTIFSKTLEEHNIAKAKYLK